MRAWRGVLAAMVVVGVLSGTAVAAVAGGGVSAAPSSDDAHLTSQRVDAPSVFTRRDGDDMVPPVITAGGDPASLSVAAPQAAVPLTVSVDERQQEQYWFWAYGVEVTVTGLSASETVTLSMTASDGSTLSWGEFQADGAGSLVQRVRYLDLVPDDNHPPVGLAQILATTSAGAAGAAAVEILPNPNETLRVSVSSPTVSQDAWFDEPVTVRAEGLQPLQKVFFNLGSPDTSTTGVGVTEGLHSNEDGVFEYVLRAATVNSLVGEWVISIQADDEKYGSTTMQVTSGQDRVADKMMSLNANSLTVSQFATKPGLTYAVSGFAPFDTYQLELITPRGATFFLGLARTNGEGNDDDAVTGPASAPTGTYLLRSRSTTTGAYAEQAFAVVTNDGTPVANPAVTVTPQTLDRSAIVSEGVLVRGTGFAPGATVFVDLRDRNYQRVALTAGANGQALIAGDGTFQFRAQALAAPLSGAYRIRVWGAADGFDYNLETAVTITEIPQGSTSSVPESTAPPAAVPSTPHAAPTSAAPSPTITDPAVPVPAPSGESTPSPQGGAGGEPVTTVPGAPGFGPVTFDPVVH